MLATNYVRLLHKLHISSYFYFCWGKRSIILLNSKQCFVLSNSIKVNIYLKSKHHKSYSKCISALNMTADMFFWPTFSQQKKKKDILHSRRMKNDQVLPFSVSLWIFFFIPPFFRFVNKNYIHLSLLVMSKFPG